MRTRARLVAAAVLAATLAACADGRAQPGDDPSSTTPAGGPTTTGQPAPETACPPGCTPPEDLGPAGDLRLPLEVDAASGLTDRRGYGRGVSIVDLDGDGWDDLVLSDTDDRFRGRRFGVTQAYRNVEGRFEPWDLGIHPDDVLMNGGAAFGDADGDGAPDLLLVNGNNTGSSVLAYYRNDLAGSGRFERRTSDAGITAEPGPWWGAAWFDADADGDLDVVVTGSRVALYLNDGTGRFTAAGPEAGLHAAGQLRNPVVIDIDHDRDLDLFITSMTGSRFYANDGAGRFTDVTDAVLGPTDPATAATWAWAAVVEDFDQDGLDDLWLGRWFFQDRLLLSRPDGTFDTLGAEAGIATQFVPDDHPDVVTRNGSSPLSPANYLPKPDVAAENTMGLGVGDLDGNGLPDVVIGTGDPTRANPQIVLCGFPDEVTRVRYERCSEPIRTASGLSRGHGAATGDLDQDGALDVVLNPGGFPPYDIEAGTDTREAPILLRGSGDGAGTAHLRLVTGEGPRSAVGARVELREPRRQFLTVRSMQGFQNQNSENLLLHVGDGATALITWPDGTVTEQAVRPGDRLVVRQP